MPQLLTQAVSLFRPHKLAGFKSESWPASFRNAGRLQIGIPGRFESESAMCHTPAGRTPTAMAAGFNPQAPAFGEDADDMGEAELFWVTRNGIRFTGMPAWNQALNDQQIWDVVRSRRRSRR